MKSKLGFALSMLLLFAVPLSAHWDLEGFEWAIVLDDDSVDVAVGHHSHHRLDRLRKDYDEPFVWVRKGRSEWVITDPSTVRQLRKVMEMPDELETVKERMKRESKALEESVRVLERRVATMERDIERGSIEAALEIAEAAKELETGKLEEAAERMEEGARELERWADELEQRIEHEALPLIEDAIRDGVAKRLR